MLCGSAFPSLVHRFSQDGPVRCSRWGKKRCVILAVPDRTQDRVVQVMIEHLPRHPQGVHGHEVHQEDQELYFGFRTKVFKVFLVLLVPSWFKN